MRKPFRIAAALLVRLFVIGAAVNGFQQKSALTPPGTLAGRTLTTDPELVAESKKFTGEMRKENGGNGGTVAMYTDGNGDVEFMLLAVRGLSTEERDLRDMASGGVSVDPSSKQSFGPIDCFVVAQTSAICLWHDDISGALMTLFDDDLVAAAALAAEAKRKLG